ncbi:MAG: type 1 glutamine amidotransferase domain-containing protein [Acidobacteriaceae bacterium]
MSLEKIYKLSGGNCKSANVFLFSQCLIHDIAATIAKFLSSYLREVQTMNNLSGKKIAILSTDGFEQVELTEPKKALEQAGAKTVVISPHSGEIKGWKSAEWGDKVKVDRELKSAKADDYDALLIPGGVMNPDKLRMDPTAINFVKKFFDSGKPVAAICHGPQMLIEAGVVKGRKLTSWPSLKTDLKNAGAEWTDQQVIVDKNLITSRKPDDLPAFNRSMIEQFSGVEMMAGRHA